MIAIAFCSLATVTLIVGILILIRNKMVYRLRSRLLAEEGDWLRGHLAEMSDGRRQGGVYERYKCLPSYDAMVLRFWRTPSSFEREIGPVEQYYPEVNYEIG